VRTIVIPEAEQRYEGLLGVGAAAVAAGAVAVEADFAWGELAVVAGATCAEWVAEAVEREVAVGTRNGARVVDPEAVGEGRPQVPTSFAVRPHMVAFGEGAAVVGGS